MYLKDNSVTWCFDCPVEGSEVMSSKHSVAKSVSCSVLMDEVGNFEIRSQFEIISRAESSPKQFKYRIAMPPVGAASVPEMTAAAALLELCSDSRKSDGVTAASGAKVGLPQNRTSPVLESTATDSLSMQNFIVTRVTDSLNPTPSPKSSPTIIKIPGGGYIVRNSPGSSAQPHKNRKRINLHKKYQDEQKRWLKTKLSTSKVTKRFRDKSTQTDGDYRSPQVEKMETFIKQLCEKISDLESRLEMAKVPSNGQNNLRSDCESDRNSSRDSNRNKRRKYNTRVKTNSSSNSFQLPSDIDSDDDSDYKIDEKDETMDISENEMSSDGPQCCKRVIRRSFGCSNEMVPIGDGNATVPMRLLKQLDWSSYTNATRKLLTAVFSRRVLATHSLTGKPSPAFPDKPAKKKLDSSLVNDIVQTVVERCKVPENVVRTSITTKCADESKMLRSRQKLKKKNGGVKKENVPPRSSESEESMY